MSRFWVGETITYGRNHMIVRFKFCIGGHECNEILTMESGFSVRLMATTGAFNVLGNRGILPSGLAHDGCALCFSFGVYAF